MLSPVPNSRRAFAAQASKLSGTGPRDDEIRLLRRAVLEYSSALKHEAARFSCNVPDDPLWQRSSSFYLGPVIGRRMSRGAAIDVSSPAGRGHTGAGRGPIPLHSDREQR